MTDFNDLVSSLDSQTAEAEAANKEAEALKLQQDNHSAVIDTINTAVKTLTNFHKKHQPKVSVTNQKLPTSIKTPDVKAVVDALNALKQPLQANKPDNSELIKAIGILNDSVSKLPTEFPVTEPVEEVTVKNQPDYTLEFQKIGNAIKSIDVKPVVNVENKPEDYTPIINALKPVVDAIQAIEIPQVPKTDLSPLIEATNAVQATIAALRFPVPNYVLPFMTQTGKATQLKLNDDGSIPTSGTAPVGGATSARQDTGNTSIASIDTKTPAQGQALAAVSSPVVLPASQITLLTPPAAITNYANETGGNLATIAAKDFATQTTLALIKAKTDNLDVALSTRTKPADTQIISGAVTATLGAETTKVIGTVNQGTSPWVTNDPGIPDTLGQKVRASSAGVTLSSEDITALTPPAAIAGFATASAQTDKSQFTKMTDGADTALITAAGEQNVLESNSAAIKADLDEIALDTDNLAPPTTVLNGKTTVITAGSRVALAVSTSCKSVTIRALAANTGMIYIGNSTVSASNGFALAAGDTISLDISNLNTVNVDSSVNGEGCSYLGVN